MPIIDIRAVTDYDIQALVDNELEWEDQKRVQEYINTNKEARKRYRELRRQKKAIQDWWKSFKISQ